MISDRLITIANMVSKHTIMADIGSDHALLPCYMVKEGLLSKAYAIDNKPGPLKGAIENVAKHGMQNNVFPILQSGLHMLPNDVKSVVIAGMGYDTIETIINADIEVLASLDEIIFQCNTDWHKLRALLKKLNISIVDEKFLKSRNKEYLFVKAIPNGNIEINNIYTGDFLLDSPQYIDYLKSELDIMEPIKQYNEDINKVYINLKQALDNIN